MCSDLLKRVSGPVEQALKSSAIPLVRENTIAVVLSSLCRDILRPFCDLLNFSCNKLHRVSLFAKEL